MSRRSPPTDGGKMTGMVAAEGDEDRRRDVEPASTRPYQPPTTIFVASGMEVELPGTDVVISHEQGHAVQIRYRKLGMTAGRIIRAPRAAGLAGLHRLTHSDRMGVDPLPPVPADTGTFCGF
jgi:hypothetical protein